MEFEFVIELFLAITALAIVLNIVFKIFEIPTIIGSRAFASRKFISLVVSKTPICPSLRSLA